MNRRQISGRGVFLCVGGGRKGAGEVNGSLCGGRGFYTCLVSVQGTDRSGCMLLVPVL